jgi:hypothetical protein
MKHPLDETPRLNEDFGWEPMPDGSVVYSMDSGSIVTINAVTELILSYCDGETSLRKILESVRADLEETALSEEEFLKTIHSLIEQKILLPSAA